MVGNWICCALLAQTTQLITRVKTSPRMGRSTMLSLTRSEKSSYSPSLRSLKETGFYLLGNPGLSQMIRAPWTSRRGSKRAIGRMDPYRVEDLIFLKELIEDGRMRSV